MSRPALVRRALSLTSLAQESSATAGRARRPPPPPPQARTPQQQRPSPPPRPSQSSGSAARPGDDEFIPTEELAPDEAVTFPVDI